MKLKSSLAMSVIFTLALIGGLANSASITVRQFSVTSDVSTVVSSNSDGYWSIITPAKIYVNLIGTTANATNIPVLANGVLSPKFALPSAATMQILSDSGQCTINLVVESN